MCMFRFLSLAFVECGFNGGGVLGFGGASQGHVHCERICCN